MDSLTGRTVRKKNEAMIYPATEFAGTSERLDKAISQIEDELQERLEQLRNSNKLVEMQRLEQRTKFDLEMLRGDGILRGHRELLALLYRKIRR